MIRVATSKDASDLEQIAGDAYSKYLSILVVPPDPLFLDYGQVSQKGDTYVLQIAGEVCGMVTFTLENDVVVLRNLALKTKYQGRGYGRLLAEHVEQQALAKGITTVELWTREEMDDNINFYVSLGYDITHTERAQDCSRVFFRKILTRAKAAV